MWMLRLPSPFSCSSVPLDQRYRCGISFFLTLLQVDILTQSARIVWVGSYPVYPLPRGGGRLSHVPVCPHSTFDVVSHPGRIRYACHCRIADVAPICMKIKASALCHFSRLNTHL